jgi:hypothetical protein
MKFKTKITLCLWKRYFDVGFGILNYVKYFVLLGGFLSGSIETTLIVGVIYAILCFIVGWAWLNSDFYTADTELSNRYNLFVDEMRKKIGKPNK